MTKKLLTIGIIILFLLSFSNITYALSSNNFTNINYEIEENYRVINFQNGSLSGYVNDSSHNSIEGALVSINCGGLHMYNITDSDGFYYIGDVPIVDCYWNVSASKKGYDTYWVDMPIDINSTYNFVLITINNIIFVGGNGPNNYSRIQDAIDNASDGDTVFVYNGTYYENLLIENSICLEGENKETTIIDGSDLKRAVNISCNNVTLKHFSIVHGRGGVNVWRSDNITITENIIKLNRGNGLFFYRSNSNTITHNVISENGIFDPNVISLCNGILILTSSDTNISGNIVHGSSSCGMLIMKLNNSIISGNNITFNYFQGLDLYVSYDNLIIRNNFIENGKKTHSRFWGDLTDNVRFVYVIFSYKKPYNNIWDGNFWGRSRILPKPVFGGYRIFEDVLFNIPWINFDWHPAKEPYDISIQK